MNDTLPLPLSSQNVYLGRWHPVGTGEVAPAAGAAVVAGAGV